MCSASSLKRLSGSFTLLTTPKSREMAVNKYKGNASGHFGVINVYASNYMVREPRFEGSVAGNKYWRSCCRRRRCLVKQWKNVKLMVTVAESRNEGNESYQRHLLELCNILRCPFFHTVLTTTRVPLHSHSSCSVKTQIKVPKNKSGFLNYITNVGDLFEKRQSTSII